MKKTTGVLLAVAALAIAIHVQAQTKDTRPIQLQSDMLTDHCGAFLEAERTRSPQWTLYLTWLQGYITGYNMFGKFPASAPQRNLARGTDMVDWSAWIKNYCTTHPLVYYLDAVDALMEEFGADFSRLPSRKQ
jgi:hypothetical protein